MKGSRLGRLGHGAKLRNHGIIKSSVGLGLMHRVSAIYLIRGEPRGDDRLERETR